MKKIAITGPESTGKTTLAAALADEFSTIWVPEFAREYLDNRPEYSREEIRIIMEGQLTRMELAESSGKDLIFYDTEMLVLKIWSEFKYGFCQPDLEQAWAEQHMDIYFLCGTDVPWQNDPLREHPGQRDELYALYKEALQDRGVLFIELSGDHDMRMKEVMRYVR
jgi:NadR type nicotinamide-nucleotide adenylyltransferase